MALIGYQFENMKINPEDDAMLYYTIMGNVFYRQLNSTNSGLFTAFTKSGSYITIQPSVHVVAGRLVKVTTPETFNVPSGSTLVFKINLHEDNIASGNINDDTYRVENHQLNLEVVASSISKQEFTELKNNFSENPESPLITIPIYNPDFQYDPEIPAGYSDALAIDLQNNKKAILHDVDEKTNQLKTEVTKSVNTQITEAKTQIKNDTTTLAKQVTKEEIANSAKKTVDATIAKAWEDYKKTQSDAPAINTDNFTFKSASGETLSLSTTESRQGGYSVDGPIYVKVKTSTDFTSEGIVLKKTNSKYNKWVESLGINITKLSNGLWCLIVDGSLRQSNTPKTVTVNGLPDDVKGQINCTALSYNGDLLKFYSPSRASDEIKIEIPAVKSFTEIRANQLIIPIHSDMTEF